MKIIRNVLLGTMAMVLVGCGSTGLPDFNEKKSNGYLNLEQIHQWYAGRSQCGRVYKHDDVLVFNTGEHWSIYNPDTGLFFMNINRRIAYNFWDKGDVEWYKGKIDRKKCGAMAKLKKDSASTHPHAIIVDLRRGFDEVDKALSNILNNKATSNDYEVASDLIKFRTYRNKDKYNQYGEYRCSGKGGCYLNVINQKYYGKLVGDVRYVWGSISGTPYKELRTKELSFEDLVKYAKDFKWEKGSSYKKQKPVDDAENKRKLAEATERQRIQALRESYVAKHNSYNQRAWNNRYDDNKSLNIGDKVCSYSNSFGYVEHISDKNVKVSWVADVRGTDGFFFGKIRTAHTDRENPERLNFRSNNNARSEWVSKDQIAKCPFDFD